VPILTNLISLPEEIIKPFESTIAPTTTDLLNDFVKLFGGEHRKGLFFRLDGPSIYLVVSTVLQFPPCPKLTRTVSFIMVRKNTTMLTFKLKLVTGDTRHFQRRKQSHREATAIFRRTRSHERSKEAAEVYILAGSC